MTGMAKRLLRLLGFIMVAIFSTQGMADCTAVNGWNNKFLTFTFPAQISVQADMPVGSVFYEAQTSFGSSGQYASCASGSYNRGVKYQNGWVADSSGIAPTNVAGVGVRLYWVYSSSTILVPDDPYMTGTGPVGIYWPSGTPSWKIQLIKTGDITGGTLQSGAWAVYGVGNTLITTLNIGGGGAITPTGCTVTNPDIPVPLGDHKKSEFGGAGSATAWQAFNIDLNCNKDARINVQIDAAQDPSNVAGVMKLDSAPGDMAATGVGVQLYFATDNSAIQFGQSKYYNTSPNGGSETVQLKARYYQTASAVTAGLANATATFTLTYK